MRSTKKLLIFDIKFIVLAFLGWRIFLFFAAFFTKEVLPLQSNFLGGGMQNYLSNPLLWGMANFDGEHYLALSKFGYQPLTYFFFPLYPIIINFLTSLIGSGDFGYLVSGQLISNLAFIVALIGLFKLVSIEFNKKMAIYTLIVLLLFPTSFYYAAVYTESLFLALVIWSFFAAGRKKFLFAAMLAGAASATRVVGIALFPALLIEYFIQNKYKLNLKDKNLYFLAISAMGLLLYMVYLNKVVGDPLEFLHSLSIYGEQRSSNLIFLPQVFYRYIFKIIPAVGINAGVISLITWMEFASGLLFLILSIIALFKTRLSWGIYSLGAYLIPTFAGSFSSMPRYVLILFPAFVLLGKFLQKLNLCYKIIFIFATVVLLTLLQAMFLHGIWVS